MKTMNSTKHLAPRKDASGFTLVEILVTLAVLALGVLGYMALQFHSITSRVYAKNVGGALAAGVTDIENKLSQAFDAASLHAGTDKPPQYLSKTLCDQADESDYESGHAYKIEWAVGDWTGVSSNPNAYVRSIKTIYAQMRWKEKGNTYSSRLATFKRNYQIGE